MDRLGSEFVEKVISMIWAQIEFSYAQIVQIRTLEREVEVLWDKLNRFEKGYLFEELHLEKR